MSNVRIVSEGLARNTKVFVGGLEVEGVSKVEIDPINCDISFVTARITIEMPELDINAES